jgi:hypothetical protein
MSSTVSEYESSSMKLNTDSLDRGLVIRKGQFVFVKNNSTEDWIAHVERVRGKKRKLYVRWMREEGPEIVMDDDFAWLSVDTVQDVAQLRPRVHPPNIEPKRSGGCTQSLPSLLPSHLREMNTRLCGPFRQSIADRRLRKPFSA